jgi:hypothetical protein
MKGSSIYIYSDGLGPFSAALFAKDIPPGKWTVGAKK